MAKLSKNGVWKAIFLTEVDFRDFNQKSLKVHRLFSGHKIKISVIKQSLRTVGEIRLE